MDAFGFIVAMICMCVSRLAHAQLAKMGTYDTNFREARTCDNPGNGEISFSNTKIGKEGRGQSVLITDLSVSRVVDGNVNVRAALAVWGNGGWRPNSITHEEKDPCKITKDMVPEMAKEIFKQMKINDCPFQPGKFKLRIPLSNLKTGSKLPTFPYGSYKSDVQFVSQDDIVLGCINVIIDITPKKSIG